MGAVGAGGAAGDDEGGGVGGEDADAQRGRLGAEKNQRVECRAVDEEAVAEVGHRGGHRDLMQTLAAGEGLHLDAGDVRRYHEALHIRPIQHPRSDLLQLFRQVAVAEAGAFVKGDFTNIMHIVGEDDGVERVVELEGVRSNAAERVGQVDVAQAGAAVEGGGVDSHDSLGQRHRLQVRAVVERVNEDGVDTGGNDDRGRETRIVLEACSAKVGQRGREVDRLHASAANKSAPLDGPETFGQDDRGQAFAVAEGPLVDGIDTDGDDDRSQRRVVLEAGTADGVEGGGELGTLEAAALAECKRTQMGHPLG